MSRPLWIRSFWIVVAAFSVALAGCDEDALSLVQPEIDVDPEQVDFGDGIVDARNLFVLTVTNRGGAPLNIQSATIEPANGVFELESVPNEVTSGQQEPLGLVFIPTAPREVYNATLLIASNDPDRPIVEVPLTGVGGVREIEVFPAAIDFGVVDEGTVARQILEIRNLGGDPLEISSIVWTSTSVDMAPAAGGFTRGTIAAKTSTIVAMEYSPVDLGGDSGTLTIRSNDEDEPEVIVPVTGRANLAPRAIAWGCDTFLGQIGCEGVERSRRFTLGFGERIGLDGRDSTDPEGTEVGSFRWVIVSQPDASTSVIFHSTDDVVERRRATGDVEVTAVGRYDVRLIVKDARGLESLDRPESHVLLAPKDLEILLRWDIVTDVDLHLIRPGGEIGDYGRGGAGTSTGTDCSTFNRAPNWGDTATEHDDPRLDIDVVRGRGPEITSLNRPDEDQPYRVVAHYCDSQNVRVPTSVTIEVYVQGELVQSVPESGLGFTLAPGEAWEGAWVTWLSGNGTTPMVDVVDRTTELPTMMPELCMLR